MRRTKAEAAQTRDHLLDAASVIILRDGVMSLTLDAVVLEAGVSKGGLLHHFPTKELLIKGVIDRMVQRFVSSLEAALEAEPPGVPGRWLRAYIRTSFAEDLRLQELGAALSIGVSAHPNLMDDVRTSFDHIQSSTEHDGLDPVRATLIRMAADGVWFSELMQLAPPNPLLRTQLVHELLAMTYP
jgi:AcrR family transcriptional regulator